MDRDQALINAYTLLGGSVDRIAVFTEVRNKFLDCLPAEVRSKHEDDQIVWRLVQLRKARKLPTNPSEN